MVADRRETDWTRHDSPSVAVVEAVADYTGRDPVDLPRPADAIDADALDELLTAARADGVRVSFTYAGHDVTIGAGGYLAVAPAE